MKQLRVLVACEFSGTVLDILNDGFDLIIAHPPCTYLCRSGLHWNKRVPGREDMTSEALAFVLQIMGADCPHIAIENPVGRIGSAIRPADQYIHPWQFGHDASKRTGLWLKGLPLLVDSPEQHVAPRSVMHNGKLCKRWANQTDSGQNALPPSADRWALRSETYSGIAAAVADQWGSAIEPRFSRAARFALGPGLSDAILDSI